MKPMTPKQRRFHSFVTRYKKRHGFSPTLTEIAAGLKVSHTSAHSMAHTMERNGHLTIIAGKARGVDTV